MNAKSKVAEWSDKVQDAHSSKNTADFEHASANLAQHQLAFEAIVSLLVALDSSVPKTNATLAPAPPLVGPGASTPREVEWTEERIQFTTARINDLERKMALQDHLLERIKAEQQAIDALSPLPSTVNSRSLSQVHLRSLEQTIADLREANDSLVVRVAEAEETIEGILNEVVEDPEGEKFSRATRLKEIFQDYRAFTEKAKTAIGVAESNSRVFDALRTQAERAIADWNKVCQDLQAARDEMMEIRNREKEVRFRFDTPGACELN